jgi:hypothetical protein
MKNKIIFKYKLSFVLLVLSLILVYSCSISKSVKAIYNENVKPQYFSFENKSIIFTPLAHFGQEQYYSNLKDSLIEWKKQGYIIFYEGILHSPKDMGVDSIQADIALRKWRRMLGGDGATREDYADLSDVKIFKNAVAQPEYIDLGIDSSDFNADITLISIVEQFEKRYNVITLDSCDLATSLDSTYTCGKKPKGNLTPIILDYRNEKLIEKIIASDHNKIAVLFGGAHIKGLKKLLKEYEKGKNKN